MATPWSVACQVPLPMEFSRPEYWSGLPFPLPGDFPNPGIEPVSPALADGFFTIVPPGKPDGFVNYPWSQGSTVPTLRAPLLPIYFELQGNQLIRLEEVPYSEAI